MNDEQLDAELRMVFASRTLTAIDPRDAASQALLAEITGTATDGDISGPEVASFDTTVVALPEPSQRWTSGRILLVAAAVVLAVLGLSRWLLPDFEQAPVISDDFDVNGAEEITPEGFLIGPIQPEVLVVDGTLTSVTGLCFLPTESLEEQGFSDDEIAEIIAENFRIDPGSASFGTVVAAGGVLLDFTFSDLQTVDEQQSCLERETRGFGTGNDARDLFQRGPLEMAFTASPNASTDIFLPGEDVVLAIGQHDGTIARISAPGIGADQQSYQPFGENWFILEYVGRNHVEVEIEFTDGRVETEQILSANFRTIGGSSCIARDCTPAESVLEITDLVQAAEEIRADRQAAHLASGVISQAEYDDARAAFLACLERSGVGTDFPLLLDAGTPDAEAAEACYDNELRLIDTARFIQAGQVFPDALFE